MAVSTTSGSDLIEHGNHEAFQNVKSSKEELSNQIGEGSDGWYHGERTSGYADFVGFNASNMGRFEGAVMNYVKDVNEILDGFNKKENVMEGAFKGKVADSLTTFFDKIKTLCQSYVNAINEEFTKVKEAQANWEKASGGVSSAINDDSSAVKPVVINN